MKGYQRLNKIIYHYRCPYILHVTFYVLLLIFQDTILLIALLDINILFHN